MSSENLNQVMRHLNLDAKCTKHYTTNSSTFFNVELGNKCTIKKFSSLIKEIEFRLKSPNPLFWKIIPEQGIVQLHSINCNLQQIYFHDVHDEFEGDLPVVLGKDYYDKPVYADFAENPHTLIAGTTGSGKTNALHNIICNFLMKEDVDLYLSDSKGVEFSIYESSDSLKCLVSSYSENVEMLKMLISIMESRFKTMQKMKISSYKQSSWLDKIVVVLDEISDLILQDTNNNFKNLLLQLTQKSRAAGIFVVAATQRPSVDILSGAIKANLPARISLKTASLIDSKVILDQPGAELLKGNGDALISSSQHQLTRFRFPLVDPKKVLKSLKS